MDVTEPFTFGTADSSWDVIFISFDLFEMNFSENVATYRSVGKHEKLGFQIAAVIAHYLDSRLALLHINIDFLH